MIGLANSWNKNISGCNTKLFVKGDLTSAPSENRDVRKEKVPPFLFSMIVVSSRKKQEVIAMRLTENRVVNILRKNEGVTKTIVYSDRHMTTKKQYRIYEGKLYCCQIGNNDSFAAADEEERACDLDQTRVFLKRFVHTLDIAGIA
jgi:hypothetical protein